MSVPDDDPGDLFTEKRTLKKNRSPNGSDPKP